MSEYYNVTTIAGNGTGIRDGSGYTLPNVSTSNVALFTNLNGIVVDTFGNIFVSDILAHQIRKVTLIGATYEVTTIAGSPAGTLGSSDGAGWTLPNVSSGNTASFNLPIGLAIDAYGNIYVADAGNNRVRKITLVGTTYQVTTIAGSPTNTTGTANGSGWTLSNEHSNSVARFHYPNGVAVDTSDNIFVTERNNRSVRRITLVGDTYQVQTIAGNPLGATSTATDGPGWTVAGSNSTNVALFSTTLVAITTDLSGNIYVVDRGHQRIRKIALVGTTYQVSTIAGSVAGSQDGQGWSLTGSNAGSIATFSAPFGIRADIYGNIFVADVNNRRIRKVSLVGNTYQVTTVAGSPTSFNGIMDGRGWTLPNVNSSNDALFNGPIAVSTDPIGNIYVAESNAFSLSRIRKIVLISLVPSTPIILSPYSFNTTQSSPYIATISGTISIAGEANNTLFVSSTLSNTMYSYSSEVSSSGNAYIYYNLFGLMSSSVSFTITTQNTSSLQYSLPVTVYLSYSTAAPPTLPTLPSLLSLTLSGSTHPNATIYASGETLYMNTSSGILILTVSGTSSNVIADISYSTLNVSGMIVGTTAYIPIDGLVATNICVLTLKDTQNTIRLYPFTIRYSTAQPSYPTVSIANTTYSTSGSPVLYTNQPSGTITISGDLNTQYIISHNTISDTSYTTTTSNAFTIPYTSLSDLSHIYTLTITNIFNTTLTAYFTIVVETTSLTPPILSISGAYVSDNIFYTNLSGAVVTVSTTSAFVSYAYSQTNSVSYNAPDPSAPIPSYTLSIPKPGVYIVYVSCKDNEGNVGQLVPITIIR